jgi:hypothetical protein
MKPCGEGEERVDGGEGAARGVSKIESVKSMVIKKGGMNFIQKRGGDSAVAKNNGNNQQRTNVEGTRADKR